MLPTVQPVPCRVVDICPPTPLYSTPPHPAPAPRSQVAGQQGVGKRWVRFHVCESVGGGFRVNTPPPPHTSSLLRKQGRGRRWIVPTVLYMHSAWYLKHRNPHTASQKLQETIICKNHCTVCLCTRIKMTEALILDSVCVNTPVEILRMLHDSWKKCILLCVTVFHTSILLGRENKIDIYVEIMAHKVCLTVYAYAAPSSNALCHCIAIVSLS